MNEDLKEHLTVVIVVSLIGIATATFALIWLKGNASSMDVDGFSLAIILIPCIVMLLASFIIAVTARRIGRHLYLAVTGVCFVSGIIAMVLTSGWMQDPEIATLLIANSPDGTTITPPIQNMLVVLRNIAAFIVCPTVGCIAGAWLGSRIHPMESVR